MKAVILYMPVIHKGYLDFIKRHHNGIFKIFLISNEVVAVLGQKEGREYLQRSFIHSVETQSIPAFIESEFGFERLYNDDRLLSYQTIEILKTWMLNSKKDIFDKFSYYDTFIFPQEDVSQYFIEDYLKPLGLDSRVDMSDNAFLRFNKAIPQNEAVVPDITMSVVPEFLREVARIAYKEAQKSSDWWRQVGAVLFNDTNWIILAGFNKHVPDEHIPNIYGDSRAFLNAGSDPDWGTALHAERMIFAKALKKGISTEGLSLYVTTYPCSGCAAMISQTGIKRIYYTEGYSMAQQAGNMLRAFDIEVIHIPKEVFEKEK
jgi:dCMP deaminase